jgi:hypothetical protein
MFVMVVSAQSRRNNKKRERSAHSRIVDLSSSVYSTVTDFARFLGWSTSQPRRTAM